MESISVACSTDDAYIDHCITMLTSLVVNNSNHKLIIFILFSSLKKENIAKLKNLEIHDKVKIVLKEIPKSFFNNKFPLSHHIAVPTYYRITLPSILNQDIDKILYLDCDMVIEKDLSALYSTDISKYGLAAVREASPDDNNVKERLGIPYSSKYFNGGVLLINLRYWRLNNISSKIINYINKNPEKIVLWDQDAMNAILHNAWLELMPWYNQQTQLFAFSPKTLSYSKDEYDLALRDPVIIHYSTSSKPWLFKNNHPFKNRYSFYRRKAGVKEFKYPDISFKSGIIRLIPIRTQYAISRVISKFRL